MATLRILFTVAAASVFVMFSTWQLLNRVVIVLVAVLVLSYIWSRWSLRGVSLSWSIPQDRAQVGQTLISHFAVANRGWLPKPWLEVRDYSSLPGHMAGRVLRLGRRGRAEWDVETVCRKRGRHQIGPMSLISSDPFGAFPSMRRIPASIDVTVYPPEFELTRFPIPTGVLTGSAATQRRTPFVTPSVAGIRDYAPGDGFNRISWTATARLGRFMVKEFDADPTSDVWIVLDCERAHRVDVRAANSLADERLRFMDSTEEYAVAAAASVAKHCLLSGRGVGLIVSAAHRDVIPAEQSERVRVKILESLAVATSDGQVPLADVLMGEWRRFGRHCGVVVITSSSDPGWVEVVSKMHAHRVQVTALVVDGKSFGGNSSMDANIDRLSQAGVPTFAICYGSDIGLALAGVA
jgi:uncharacterized protein (DUF58 family)